MELTDNSFDAIDFGWCKNECQSRPEPINRRGLCECCYLNATCCVSDCDNTPHVEGEGCCSLHELEAAQDAGDGAEIALWETYFALDVTLTHREVARA